MTDRDIIMVDAEKRGGRPCIRGLRITVDDVLSWIASGMSEGEIVSDYPDLSGTTFGRRSRMRRSISRGFGSTSERHIREKRVAMDSWNA